MEGVLLNAADKALHRLKLHLDSMYKMLQLQAIPISLLKMVILIFKICYCWLQLLDSGLQ